MSDSSQLKEKKMGAEEQKQKFYADVQQAMNNNPVPIMTALMDMSVSLATAMEMEKQAFTDFSDAMWETLKDAPTYEIQNQSIQ